MSQKKISVKIAPGVRGLFYIKDIQDDTAELKKIIDKRDKQIKKAFDNCDDKDKLFDVYGKMATFFIKMQRKDLTLNDIRILLWLDSKTYFNVEELTAYLQTKECPGYNFGREGVLTLIDKLSAHGLIRPFEKHHFVDRRKYFLASDGRILLDEFFNTIKSAIFSIIK